MDDFPARAVLVLQCFHVAFLALHDWIPLGPLNDVEAVRAENSTAKLLRVTLVSTLPFAFGLAASFYYLGHERGYPGWLLIYLGISYGLLFLGKLQAWWIAYFFRAEPRASRYQAMCCKTHAFLPEQNGIRPNTLHVSTAHGHGTDFIGYAKAAHLHIGIGPIRVCYIARHARPSFFCKISCVSQCRFRSCLPSAIGTRTREGIPLAAYRAAHALQPGTHDPA